MKMKRIVLLVLAALLFLTSTACSKTQSTDKVNTSVQSTQTNTKTGPLFDKPVTLSMITTSNASYPYQADWVVWNYIKEATNVNLNVQAYGAAEYNDKLQLTMASGKLPDIVYLATEIVNKYALDGPFVDIISNMSKCPNFSKWYNSSDTNKETLKTYTSADAKVYVFPLVGGETTINKRGWMVRMDILQKNNLKVPTTYDELYTVLKELKKVYPNSYPLSVREFIANNLDLFAVQWSTRGDAYYDFTKKEWRYGPIEDNFKNMILFFRKLYSEGLIPMDILTISTKGWTDMMSSSQSFFTVDYVVRIDYFNKPMQKEIPTANLDYMSPPKGGENGKAIFAKTNYAGGGDVICKTSNSDNAMKFVDWMYSPEAKELLVWGKEGVTYKVVNGEKEYITDANSSQKEKMYGLMTFGIGQQSDTKSAAIAYKGQCYDALVNKTEKDSEKNFNPKWWMDFTKAEKDVKLSLEETIRSRMQENISKFVIGEMSMDQWDNYVNGIKQLGIDKYLAVCKSAYDRVK